MKSIFEISQSDEKTKTELGGHHKPMAQENEIEKLESSSLTSRSTSSTTDGSFVRKTFLDVTPMVVLKNVKESPHESRMVLDWGACHFLTQVLPHCLSCDL